MKDTNYLGKSLVRLAAAKEYQVKAAAEYQLALTCDDINEANDAFNEYEIANRAVFVLETYYNAFADGKSLAEATLLAADAIEEYETEE